MAEPRRFLGIFPHPDDESYSAGGTMAKLAAAGVEVHVLSATRGEAGQIVTPGSATLETLAAVREEELRAACVALGACPPRFLGYRDGTLAQQDLAEAVGRIVRVLRAVRPHVVVTLGADGVYGHPDHVALHRMVLPAFRSAAGASRFPDEEYGPSWAPARLFWTAFPRGHFRSVWERLLDGDLADGVRQMDPEKLGVPDDQFHAVIDVADYVKQKLAAIQSHRTQVRAGAPYGVFPPGILEPIVAVERFTLALGNPPATPWPDLFAGL